MAFYSLYSYKHIIFIFLIKTLKTILSEAELACKGEADVYTYYVMNTIYCVFAFSKIKT